MPNRIESGWIKVDVKVDRNKPVWVADGELCYHYNRDCVILNRTSNPIVEITKGEALDSEYERCDKCNQ